MYKCIFKIFTVKDTVIKFDFITNSVFTGVAKIRDKGILVFNEEAFQLPPEHIT